MNRRWPQAHGIGVHRAFRELLHHLAGAESGFREPGHGMRDIADLDASLYRRDQRARIPSGGQLSLVERPSRPPGN